MRPSRPRGGKSFGELFPQLFLIPLLLVTVGVFVYIFFVQVAQDQRSIGQLLSDIQSGGQHARGHDAFQLAQLVKRREEESPPGEPFRFSEPETAQVLDVLERNPDEASLREYLIKALGRAGRREQAVPALFDLLRREGASDRERAATLQALGFSRSPKAVPALIAELERLRRVQAPWELRLYAIVALTQIVQANEDIEDASGIAAALRPSLRDPRPELQWNTASYLAEYFGDSAGAEVLRRLADLGFLERHRGDEGRELTAGEKESWLMLAASGLHAIEGEAARDRLRALREVAREKKWFRLLDTVIGLLGESEGDAGGGNGNEPSSA